MASVAELDEAVRTAREAGCRDLVLLKCTSTYPATPENTNILTIPRHARALRLRRSACPITPWASATAVAAVALGASMIEKHFTLRRADGGVDSAFSLEPPSWRSSWWKPNAPGIRSGASATVRPPPSAVAGVPPLAVRRRRHARRVRRSPTRNLRVVRPAGGLHPRFYEQLLGRRVRRDVHRGTAVDWSLLE